MPHHPLLQESQRRAGCLLHLMTNNIGGKQRAQNPEAGWAMSQEQKQMNSEATGHEIFSQ